ncbi:MAG: dihydroorotase [Granulosicoccus sp.]
MSVSSAERIIITNIRLLGSDELKTIIVQDGKVESIDRQTDSQKHETGAEDSKLSIIDAKGSLAIPGLTDLYTRLREPGMTRKGTLNSESHAAIASGFTRLLCAPDTQPAIDNIATVELIRQRANLANAAHVIPIAALTVGLKGEQLSELATLQSAGCLVAGQADSALESTNVLYSAMEYAASFDMPLFMTARDAQLGADGCAHTGAMATRLGLPSIPIAAETVALARLLELCRETGCRLHISRISSARAVDMINEAKQAALPVSCDVGIHHLFFSDEDLAGYDAHFHSAVPFRSVQDRNALQAGVKNGSIDAICTDHAPHDIDASLAPFPVTEPGLSAYDWFIPLLLQLPQRLNMSLNQVLAKFIDAPAMILTGVANPGLDNALGKPADFFLLDPDQDASKRRSHLQSAGANHPLNTHEAESLNMSPLKGVVTHAATQERFFDFSV